MNSGESYGLADIFLSPRKARNTSRSSQMPERARYRAGSIVVRYGEAAGTNLCSVYHPEQYVRERLAGHFSVVSSHPRSAAGNGNQDTYLLRKSL